MGVVDQLRGMVAAGTAEYVAGTATYWTDDQLQEILDRHRTYYPETPLEWCPERGAGGTIVYQRARLQPMGVFNAGTVPGTSGTIITGLGGTIAGTIGQDGWVTFGSNLGGTVLYFRGHSYDLHGAAAEVLETWAGVEKLAFDVDTEGHQRYARSQKVKMLLELAAEHRRRALARTVPTFRPDERSGRGNGWDWA